MHFLHGCGRPQFLVLSGAPSSRPDMVHFVNQISKEVGVMVCGHVLLVSISVVSKYTQLCICSYVFVSHYHKAQ